MERIADRPAPWTGELTAGRNRMTEWGMHAWCQETSRRGVQYCKTNEESCLNQRRIPREEITPNIYNADMQPRGCRVQTLDGLVPIPSLRLILLPTRCTVSIPSCLPVHWQVHTSSSIRVPTTGRTRNLVSPHLKAAATLAICDSVCPVGLGTLGFERLQQYL
jgi:hypothetical protein